MQTNAISRLLAWGDHSCMLSITVKKASNILLSVSISHTNSCTILIFIFKVMKDELEVSMQMLGLTDIGQAHKGLINTLDLDHLVSSDLGESRADSIRARI